MSRVIKEAPTQRQTAPQQLRQEKEAIDNGFEDKKGLARVDPKCPGSKEFNEALVLAHQNRGLSEPDAVKATDSFLANLLDYISNPEMKGWGMLMKTDRDSFKGACIKLAAMDMPPNRHLGYGWLTPKNDRRANKIMCVPVPGVRGMERRIMRTGQVLSIKAGAIRSQDDYKFLEGVNEDFQFTRNLSPDLEKPNQIIAAYCVIKMKENPREDFVLKVMPIKPSDLNTNYMDQESAAKYVAQRAAMREVIHTKLHALEGVAEELAEMLSVERESYQQEDAEMSTGIDAVPAEPETVAPPKKAEPETVKAEMPSRSELTIDSPTDEPEPESRRESPFRLDYTEEELNGEDEPAQPVREATPTPKPARSRRTM